MPELLSSVMPVLGYVIANLIENISLGGKVAVVLLIATLTFMSAVSTAIITSAQTMAQVLVIAPKSDAVGKFLLPFWSVSEQRLAQPRTFRTSVLD